MSIRGDALQIMKHLNELRNGFDECMALLDDAGIPRRANGESLALVERIRLVVAKVQLNDIGIRK